MNEISLRYSDDMQRRLWLADDGFSALHEAIRIGCQHAYPVSSVIDPSTEYERRYYLLRDPSKSFVLYDTDTHTPDDFKGIFYCPHDATPGPFGDFGFGTGKSDERTFSLHSGYIRHNPDHGRLNVSQRSSPRLRKSEFVENWSFTAEHHYIKGQPSTVFSYWLSKVHLGGDCSGTLGLLKSLKLEPMTAALVRKLPSYGRLLRHHPSIELSSYSFLDEVRESPDEPWQGEIQANIKTSWLSSESRTFLLD